ncbi:septal ring lytic transglycosylase RlpA family protein [Labilibacter sediminis]|nr:septal ring lytic transglycosylase RlpA family protein [Labilibacter sediminis]
MKQLTFLFLLFIVSFTLVTAQEQGKASYYADKFEGRKTASGEIYHHHLKTAAHRTLPFGTMVRVTNLSNNKTVDVKINDRGPFIAGRIIDLSKSAAQEIGAVQKGIVDVKLLVLEPFSNAKKSQNTSIEGK